MQDDAGRCQDGLPYGRAFGDGVDKEPDSVSLQAGDRTHKSWIGGGGAAGALHTFECGRGVVREGVVECICEDDREPESASGGDDRLMGGERGIVVFRKGGKDNKYPAMKRRAGEREEGFCTKAAALSGVSVCVYSGVPSRLLLK